MSDLNSFPLTTGHVDSRKSFGGKLVEQYFESITNNGSTFQSIEYTSKEMNHRNYKTAQFFRRMIYIE
jgi:hypothetical protein